MNSKELNVKTENALGQDVVKKIRETKYCIVGCGAIGANFAEMLTRTGAQNINLIDGDEVAESNLNRVFNFYQCDIGKKKVAVIRATLKKINPGIDGTDIASHFKEIPLDCKPEARKEIQKGRDLVCDSDIICSFADDNETRIRLAALCRTGGLKKNLSAAIRIEPDGLEGEAFFECGWNLKIPENKEKNRGYANDASLACIIMEVTAVAFSMLLHNLKDEQSRFFRYEKTYKGFRPNKLRINGTQIYP